MPVSNQFGTATITVKVNDGSLTSSRRFSLTVNPVNDPPVISDIPDQTVTQGNSTDPIPFTIGDVETVASSLTVSGTSSNPALVPNANIVFGGSGANRTIQVTPAVLQSGSATITVTVSDGSLSTSDSFVLTVNPIVSLSMSGLSKTLTPQSLRAGGPISVPGSQGERRAMLRVNGASQRKYMIEASEDLISWTPLGVVQSPDGISSIADPGTPAGRRF